MDKNMNNDKVNDNYDTTIDNSTLRIATLEKEYDRYLKLYQIAQQNRIKILNTQLKDFIHFVKINYNIKLNENKFLIDEQ